MTTSTFPSAKSGDTHAAANGIVYIYEENRWRVKSFKVEDGDGGTTNAEISDTPPPDAETGSLWFNNAADELTLYVFDGTDWIPAAPPVSVEGIEQRVSYLEPLVQGQQQRLGMLSENAVTTEKRLNQLDQAESQLEAKVEEKADMYVVERDFVTTSKANKTYLKDGMTTNKLMINRTAGGSIDSMKVTAITGGATIWRFDCKAGKGGPVIYQTEDGAVHTFKGKVDVERVADTKQGFCLKGRKADGKMGEVFYIYHNGAGIPDAVNYDGKIGAGSNIVNKKYVDDKIAALEARVKALGG